MAIDLAQRAALLQAHPEHFYLTEHYRPHPMLLMRPAKISRAELQRVLRLAWAFVSSELASKDLVPRV